MAERANEQTGDLMKATGDMNEGMSEVTSALPVFRGKRTRFLIGLIGPEIPQKPIVSQNDCARQKMY